MVNKMKNKSVLNFLFGLLNQIVTLLLCIILPRLLIVNLGSEANGLLSSVNQVFAYVALLEAGIGTTAVQALYHPFAIDDKKAINQVLAAAKQDYRRISIVYLLCVAAVACFYPLLVKSTIDKASMFLVVIFTGLGGVINFYFQQVYITMLTAEGKYYVITNVNLIVTIIQNAAKVLLLLMGMDVVAIAVASFCITIARTGTVYCYVKKNYGWIDLNVKPNKDALMKRKYVILQEISYFIYSNTDILLLTFFCDLKVVSVYYIYNLIFGVAEGFQSSLSSSFVFQLGQTYSVSSSQFSSVYDRFEITYRTFVFLLMTVIALIIMPFLKLYTSGVGDINYIDPTLAALFVALKLVTAIRAMSQNVIKCVGHFKETKHQPVIESVLNIVISILGVRIWGIYGVVLGSILSTIYRGIAASHYANRDILKRSSKESVKAYLFWLEDLIALLTIYFSLRGFAYQATTYVNLVIRTIVCLFASAGVYLMLMYFQDRNCIVQYCQIAKTWISKRKK